MMRLAIVATPAYLPDLRPAPGALDGDVIRSRLPLPDTDFHVVDLDPGVDLAEQLETFFEQSAPEKGTPVLFYASSTVALSGEGELFLCLDPANPGTGDSLHDIALVFHDRAPGPVAFVIECRHAPDSEDPFASASVVSAGKEAITTVGGPTGRIELLIAARPLSDEPDDHASPLTRVLIESLDEADPDLGLTLARFFEEVRESERLVGVVPCFAHARAKRKFFLLPLADADVPADSVQVSVESVEVPSLEAEVKAASEPPAPDVSEQEATASEPEEPAEDAPAEDAPAEDAPAEDAPAEDASAEDAPTEDAPAEDAALPVATDDATEAAAPIEKDNAAPPVVETRSSAPPPSPVKQRPSEPPPAPVKQRSTPAPSMESALAKVIIADRPPVAPASVAPPAPTPSTPPPAPVPTASDHVAVGDALLVAKDAEGALSAYKRALALLYSKDAVQRGEIYVRIGEVKELQEKPREAIASYEKALQLAPANPKVIERLVDLNVVEGEHRAIQIAEDRLLATLTDPEPLFARLLEFGARWDWLAEDLKELGDEQRDAERALVVERARSIYERARAIRPDDLGVLGKLCALFEAAGAVDDALATRRRIAELTVAPREKAEHYSSLAKYCLAELKREELALELFDLALESDPTLLEPLTVVARFYAERQEWSELERSYRTMLERAQRIQRPAVRSEVTWELCRRLGLLFRDHLEDPALALDAFEDAVAEKKGDLPGRLTTADLARSIGRHDRAAIHLQAAAQIEPRRVQTFHDLFDAFQKLRRPDQAYAAAQVTMYLGKAETRERFIFEELRPDGVPKLVRVMRAGGWGLLRVRDRDVHVEAIHAAVGRAARVARLAQLADEGRLPTLDPEGRQDPQKSTVTIVRSFAWASHFLGVDPPAIYLHDDDDVGLAAVIAEEEAAFAGGRVLRGRSLAELAFIAGRHLAYHVGAHRLLLYYPSIEELSACFLAAVKIALPELPIPANIRTLALDLKERIAAELDENERADLDTAVEAFKAAGGRADITAWVASVERCATRAGYLLSGDLDVAATILREEPAGVVDAEDKIADLISFAVSEEHTLLREELGIAVQP